MSLVALLLTYLASGFKVVIDKVIFKGNDGVLGLNDSILRA